MSHLVKIPAIGESVTEGTVARLLVANGAVVTDSTPLFELETDKITTEVQSGAAGQVLFKVKAGEVLAVGAVVAEIDTSVKPEAAAAKPAAKAPAKAPDTAADCARTLSPAAAKTAAESGIDPATVAGSGKDGRVTKGDLLAAQQARSAAPAAPAAAAPATTPSAPSAAPGPGAGGSRKRMSPIRQRIAQRLVYAQRTAAILTTFNEVDMSAVMALRKRFKDEFEKKHGVGLGFMPFFAAACVNALAKYPLVNSWIDGNEVVTPDGVHLGVAVGTERGLVVPVLRHAEQLGFAAIEKGIRGFAAKAKEGKLGLDDMQGGTFTITNGGVYGSLMSTPIINPPQSGILGMHAIKDRPVAVDGQVVIRPMMYLALSYDHRIVDGAEAVGFLVRVKELIEAPERLVLGL
jgi:2-oxoglutarate dehydrogenase E2 component (dihydrolipoamide succinyltransferase)